MTVKATAITQCKECGSTDLTWQTSNVVNRPGFLGDPLV